MCPATVARFYATIAIRGIALRPNRFFPDTIQEAQRLDVARQNGPDYGRHAAVGRM
jgi:hypothetical protein